MYSRAFLIDYLNSEKFSWALLHIYKFNKVFYKIETGANSEKVKQAFKKRISSYLLYSKVF
jgi:hypothetical protein